MSNEQRLTKRAVVEAYCQLSSEVAEALKWQHAADCFCGHPDSYPTDPTGYQYERRILEFLREAIREKIARDKTALERVGEPK